MPDRRQHRGPHPGDRERFAAANLSTLRRAGADFAWLLAAGYANRASIKLVGDRFALDKRQREAVWRASCPGEQAAARIARRIRGDSEPELWLDGFNVLTTVEAALAGGVVLACTDSCFRDAASVHGTWRRVEETIAAATHIGEHLVAGNVAKVVWWLDAPVGNSGRLSGLLRQLAAERGWPWQVEVVRSPDHQLSQREVAIATADGAILDRDVRWGNLARAVVERLEGVWCVDLDTASQQADGS